MQRRFVVPNLLTIALALGFILVAAASPGAFYAIVEAEAMQLTGDWRVAADKEGHCPAYPQFWSGTRLRGGAGAERAVATQEIDIPADGTYAVWVRYESPYGFDARFDVSILQGPGTHPKAFTETFGDRDDLKSFYGNWRVQGPWAYHNADFVCQKALARLQKGKATVVLAKGDNGKQGAVRMIDLIAITDDLEREQAKRSRPRPWDPECLVDHCRRTFYFRVQVDARAPARVGMAYSLFSPSAGLSFRVSVPFMQNADLVTYPASTRATTLTLPKDVKTEPLPAGFDTGWRPYPLSTLCTAEINLYTDAPVVFSASRHADGRDAVSFTVDPADPKQADGRFIVGTGFALIEDFLLGREWMLRHREISRRQHEAIAAYPVPGKPPFKYLVQVSGLPVNLGPYGDAIKQAVGRSIAGYEPALYQPGTAAEKGINRTAGGYYFPLHNALLKRACYEGDYESYRKALGKLAERAREDNLGDMPWLVKLIEEAGPPSLAVLRTWPVIADKFRAYLQSLGAKPAEMLPADALAAAIAEGRTADGDLWPRVQLSDGSVQAAAENPVLYYRSKMFAGDLFIENLANGVKLIEEILPKGSAGDLGCAWTQDGHGVRHNWYDEMMLFRKRGATAFGTENTWGLCGMAHYLGPQTESYQGALARACAKYHPDTRLDSTTAVFSWHLYGYPPEYAEMTAYALAANGVKGYCYATCGDWATVEILKAWKRASHAIGGVEDHLVPAKMVPGKVALGWSETTTVWEQAVASDPGFNMPGNVLYQLERHYLYILLRHLQLPVELLSDADIEEGRLQDYQVYVMVGDHTTRRAAEQIRRWVEAGGVLVSGAGGGLLDEFNRPLDTLTEVYGIKGQRQYAAEQGREYIPGQAYADGAADNKLEKFLQAPRAKLELIHAHPTDAITVAGFDGGKLPVLGARQTFTAAGGGVVGTFAAGQPAVVTNAFGEGRALLMGFLPGISYFYQAFPKQPYGRGGEDLSLKLFPQCKPLLRDALAQLLRQVWPRMGASVTTSHPFVEANLMRNGDDYHIALVNFSGTPVNTLDVTVSKRECGQPVHAEAAYGKLEVEDRGDALVLKMPLEQFDFVTLRR